MKGDESARLRQLVSLLVRWECEGEPDSQLFSIDIELALRDLVANARNPLTVGAIAHWETAGLRLAGLESMLLQAQARVCDRHMDELLDLIVQDELGGLIAFGQIPPQLGPAEFARWLGGRHGLDLVRCVGCLARWSESPLGRPMLVAMA